MPIFGLSKLPQTLCIFNNRQFYGGTSVVVLCGARFDVYFCIVFAFYVPRD